MIGRRRFLALGAGALAGGVFGGACRSTVRPEYDVCIVGSGFAGTFLGLRLVERGVKTVIVEAGGHLPAAAPVQGAVQLFPWRGSGDTALPLDATRSIAVGGTSRQWAGFVSRLQPSDFAPRPLAGGFADWPLSYADLDPYYCAAERALGTAGAPPIAGAEPPRRCAYPFEVGPYTSPARFFASPAPAWFPPAFSSRDGVVAPIRLADVELRRFAAAPTATLLAERPVTRLVTDDGASIARVESRRPDGAIESITARYVVVAAGVLETARLLLVSRSAWFPDGLGNRHDLLGRHCSAHPRFQRRLPHPPDTPSGRHRTYAFDAEQRRAGQATFLFDLRFDAAVLERNLLNAILELEPAADKRILLSEAERDTWGRPIAALHMDWSAIDRASRARALALHETLWRRIAPTAPSAQPALTWFHPAGGCRMAADAAHGVVDADGRVFDLDNLYVAGASVFPTAGSANPTLTVVALALRLADHLAARLGTG